MTVLEQRVFDGLGAADEQAAIKAVLFLGDPVAAFVLADKDDGRCRATRWRFDELHVGIPSKGEWGALAAQPLAISSRPDMNSRAARRRSHRSRIGSRAVSNLSRGTEAADQGKHGRVRHRLIPAIESAA